MYSLNIIPSEFQDMNLALAHRKIVELLNLVILFRFILNLVNVFSVDFDQYV